MNEICEFNLCTGCSACASICSHRAITMVDDGWGFKRPKIDILLCIDCGSCRRVCPAVNNPDRKNRLQKELFYAAYHRDGNIRMSSSSGGAFSALSTVILSRGGYICAAAFDEQYKKLSHIIIDNEKKMSALRASKYMQSDMNDCLPKVKKLLKAGKEVLFAGTPCQVAGLHLFLHKEYINLTTVDIVCHGVPSPRIYLDYIQWLEYKYGSILKSYTFRDKRWSWWRFNMKATFNNGVEYVGKWESDPYFRGFLADYFLRECCYKCQFSKHLRYSDITLSDFWGYCKDNGGFEDDDKGISMCMLNTEKGVKVFELAQENLIYCLRPRDMSLSNGGFKPREQNLLSREAFLQVYQRNGFNGCLNSYFKPLPLTARSKILYTFGRGSLWLRVYDKCKKLKSLLRFPRSLMKLILNKFHIKK